MRLLAVPHIANTHSLPMHAAGAIALVTLLVLLLSAATADRTGLPGALVLAASSVVWLFVNRPMEGAVLFIVSEGHGLTAADLVGLTGLGLAVWRFILWRRSRPRI